MSNISQEYWEDIIPDDPEGYERFMDWVHEFKPGNVKTYGIYHCIETQYRRDGTAYVCNGSSHDSMHLPIDGCCYCKHGVYLHTTYDIPCGKCEMGDDEPEDENEGLFPLCLGCGTYIYPDDARSDDGSKHYTCLTE